MANEKTYTPEELRALADEALAELSNLDDPNESTFFYGEKIFNATELMEDLRKLTPRGVAFAKMHELHKTKLASRPGRMSPRERRVVSGLWITAAVLAVLVYLAFTAK